MNIPQEKSFSFSSPPRLRERVRVMRDMTCSYERFGTVSGLVDYYVRVLLESGGVAVVPVHFLAPAPTMSERLPQYRAADVQVVLSRMILQRLEASSDLRETASRIGTGVAEVAKWMRIGKIPAERLSLLADVLEIAAGDVRTELDDLGASAAVSPVSDASLFVRAVFGCA